ncbi:MAG TPA: mitochondrial fission ELM1 family protein [Hyphomicrobium sp.]|jgi:hypothetical protein
MATIVTSVTAHRTQPLAGLTAWLVSTGMTGMDVQMRGVADALGLDYQMKHITPRGIWKAMAPWGPVAPSERFGQSGAPFSAPWPAVAIGLGRSSAPYLRALRRHADKSMFTLMMQDTKAGVGIADLIWVPEHDRLRGPNVITTLVAPHSFNQERLAELHRLLPAPMTALPTPRAAVVLGGTNAVYRYTERDCARLAGSLASLGALGASFLITSSRRTQLPLLQAVEEATRPFLRILYAGKGDNPYGSFLAHADFFVVTADSVNMTGEACATGRPVLVFIPTGGSPKFQRFHAALQAYGATRPLPERVTKFPDWHYAPLHSARDIAREVEKYWLAKMHEQMEPTSR